MLEVFHVCGPGCIRGEEVLLAFSRLEMAETLLNLLGTQVLYYKVFVAHRKLAVIQNADKLLRGGTWSQAVGLGQYSCGDQ